MNWLHRRRTCRLLPSLILLFIPLWAWSAQQTTPPTLQDFAWGKPLLLDGEGGLYRLPLPEEVHRGLARADLGDLRVFNGAGELVPQLLLDATAQAIVPEEPVALPWFALPTPQQQAQAGMGIRIRTDLQGAVVDVQRQGWEDDGPAYQYLIDASALERPMLGLRLQWQAGEENFLLPITVELSDDLQHWRRLPGPFSIASMQQGEAQLRQDTLSFDGLESRYLRISWPLASRGQPLDGVFAQPQGERREPARQWLSLTPQSMQPQQGEYHFEVTGYYPFEYMQLVLPQDNTTALATLYSSASLEAPSWYTRHYGMHYRLGQWRSPSVAMRPSRDRHWRLQVDMGGGGLGQGAAQLRLGWTPRTLLFLARGEGPFMLAFGAYNVPTAQDEGLRSLMASSHQATEHMAQLGPRVALGGVERLTAAPEPLPWGNILLWAVLLLGVALLAAMAWQLARQMRDR